MGVCNYSMFCCTLLYVNSSFFNRLDWEERAGCLVFLVSGDRFVTLPRGAMDLPAVCECGIS